jgi:ABC-type antimicrobial peptide transport system permease subunit
VPGTFVTLAATMTITGVIQQDDIDDAYWGAARISFSPPTETETMGPVLQAILPERSFYKALPQALPQTPSVFQLSSFADLSKIDSANLQRVRDSIATMKSRLEDHGALGDTPMAFTLADFNQRASFNQVTLLLLLLQVVGIAIYYVLLVSSLLVERRSEEIAMLRSRGASVLQVTGLAAAEAIILALIVALIAPFLASAVVALLGLTGTFKSVSGGGLLPFTLVPQSFLLGLAGAFIAAVAVVIPAFFTARQGMVVFLRGSARPGKSFIQRYYIDLGLVGLAALALWQVNQRGSVFDPRSVGGWSADPLMLLSPLLVIVAVGALMFRFLPFILGAFGKLVAATSGPAAVTLGLWQMTRSPSRYTQLALLVVMAAAVGTFAATYGATTERSQEDRARFEAGVDFRLNALGNLDRYDMDRIKQDLGAIPGVNQASAAYRVKSQLGPLASGGNPVTLLGVDPSSAAQQVWFRDDFSGDDLSTLMGRLEGSQAVTGRLDLGDATAVSLWLNPTNARANTTLWLRTVDAGGFWRLNEVTKLDFTGYRKFTVSFAADAKDIVYPLQLAGVLMTQGSAQDIARGDLLVDDIATIDASGREKVVEDFEGGFGWDLLRTPTRSRDAVARGTQQMAHAGQGALRYSFLAGESNPIRGFFVASSHVPLPAVASANFLAANGLSVGQEAEVVLGPVIMPVSIQGEVKYFPTMDDDSAGFLILNGHYLDEFAQLATQTSSAHPNEAWLTVSSDPAERVAVYNTLEGKFNIGAQNIVDVQQLLGSLSNDPIVRAGGSGVLLIALIAAFAILALGFGLTLYLGGQARSLEVSVLRAVGLSPGQVFVMICLEYLLVAAIGLAVGTVAGLRISETMLDFLNVTENGRRLLPPFALSTRWDTVGIAVLATAGAFMVGIVALAGYFLRLPVSRVLRMTR